MQSTTRENNYEHVSVNHHVCLLRHLRHQLEKGEARTSSKLKEILALQDINYKMPHNGNTALHVVVETDRWFVKCFAELLINNYGADPTITNDKGQTVVHWIISQIIYTQAQESKTDWTNFLLTKIHIQDNNTTNFTDVYGLSHFHAACMINGIEIVEFFLNNGVSIDEAVNMDSPKYAGRTPLHFAAEYGYTELVDRLLRRGAKLSKDSDGMTPLHMLVKRNMELVQRTSLQGFLSGEITEEWHFPLGREKFTEKLLAEMDTNEKIIRSIISKTDKSAIDASGLLPFYVMRAFEDTTLNWTRSDINSRISADSALLPGYTALHFAARFNVDTVKLLLKEGADMEAKDDDGVTPLDLCLGRYSLEDIHLIISSHSIWQNILLSDGKTKLLDLVYAMRDREEFVKFLREMQEDINDITIPKDSPLWPGYTILHVVLALSKKGMRMRIAGHRELFSKEFVMEESLRPKVMIYTSYKYSEEQLTRRPNEILEVCLSSGAKVTAQDSNGSTPIHLAFRRMNLESLYFLLQRYTGHSDLKDQDNLSLLHIACAVEDVNMVKELIAHGADVNGAIKPSFQWDPDVRYFYDLRSDKHLHVWAGATPLHVVMVMIDGRDYDCKEIVELLLEAGANMDARDVDGLGPLHRLFAQYRRLLDSEYDSLLSRFVSRDSVINGLSYLHVAAFRGCPKLVEKLLDLGADVNSVVAARDWTGKDLSREKYDKAVGYGVPELSFFFSYFEGNTPLHMVLCYGTVECDTVKILISRGADVLAKNSQGLSPIYEMLNRGMQCLLGHYVSMMSGNDEKRLVKAMGLTKLHLASQLCDVKIIRDCLKKGANVNARVSDDSELWPGFTPLHIVVNTRYDEKTKCRAVRLLLSSGADVMIANANGKTPLMLDIHDYHVSSRPRHINLLWNKLKNSVVNPTSDEGISHFHLACIRSDVALVERFLKMGVDANQTVDYYSKIYPGYTPLHFAVCRTYGYLWSDLPVLKTIKLLLEHGANVNAMTVDNETPLHLAGDSPSLCALPYKRLFWAGADPEIRTLFIDKPPRCRLFNVESGEVRSRCHSEYKCMLYRFKRTVVLGPLRCLYKAYCKVRKWYAGASTGT